MRPFPFALLAALALSAPVTARAQSIQAVRDEHRALAYGRLGTDYALLTTTLGASLRLGEFEAFSEALLPTATFGDFAVSVGGRRFIGRSRWRVPLELGLITRRADNEVVRAFGFGLRGALAPGYYGPRLTLAAEGHFDFTALTHLKHSALYRELYLPEAQDGWYALSARTFGLGGRAAWRISRWSVTARGGARSGGQLDGLAPSFYAQLGAEVGF